MQLFTKAAILDLLLQIDELKDLDIELSETSPDIMELHIGESRYIVKPSDESEIKVSDKNMQVVDNANAETYQNLSDIGEIDLTEPVTSGVLKEVAKTLLVGGIVRLTSKLFK